MKKIMLILAIMIAFATASSIGSTYSDYMRAWSSGNDGITVTLLGGYGYTNIDVIMYASGSYDMVSYSVGWYSGYTYGPYKYAYQPVPYLTGYNLTLHSQGSASIISAYYN